MIDYELINIDPDDIGDVLVKVERSFNIKFVGDELQDIDTFGKLCDHITNKIQLENVNDCTTQQAFYKLRQAFNMDIHPQTLLADILPEQSRIAKVKSIEKLLGFSLSLFHRSGWLAAILPGKKLELETVGEVVEKMTREHYLRSRRNSSTVNKAEVEKVLIDLFSKDLGLDKSKLNREAEFG